MDLIDGEVIRKKRYGPPPGSPSNNPTGKGGFRDHPENIQPCHDKPLTYRGALRKFGSMTPRELLALQKKGPLLDRDDITINEACAIMDSMLAMQIKHNDIRVSNANQVEGLPRQTVAMEFDAADVQAQLNLSAKTAPPPVEQTLQEDEGKGDASPDGSGGNDVKLSA